MTSYLPTIPNPLPILPSIAQELENQVYTHPTSTSSGACGNPVSWERLEFVGNDSLRFAMAAILYDHGEPLNKREMHELQTLYVSNGNLARWGRAYDFDTKVTVGQAHVELEE